MRQILVLLGMTTSLKVGQKFFVDDDFVKTQERIEAVQKKEADEK